MKPELKAFRHYYKNLDFYLSQMQEFWGDDEKLMELYNSIANKFGATGEQLQNLIQISYDRYTERVFK